MSKFTAGRNEYFDLGWRFDLSKPVYVRFQDTEVVTPDDYAIAARLLTEAIPGLTFVLEDKLNFSPPLDNRVIFCELDGRDHWDAVATPIHVADDGLTLMPCVKRIDSFVVEDGQLVDYVLTGQISGLCDKDKHLANAGLIVFDTGKILPAWDNKPLQAARISWIQHEFLHLLGLGHVVNGPYAHTSIMVPAIHKNRFFPWKISSDDYRALEFLGYRESLKVAV